MSTNLSTVSTPPTTTHAVGGRFIEVVTSDRAKQTIKVACGNCTTVNQVNVPKKIYHVVVTGGGACGIFDSSTIADSFVLGVSGAVRAKAESLEEAIASVSLAIAQEKFTVLERANTIGN
ncbi:hypothetical protein FA13DRAFT_1806695 [Coprinellus micaceus]|uniref:Uncharacterized protein n=1 Tax=Coprinellus micaceus TaxID=71717 RepID=A0A4Y7RJU4_COPMI|nr:hypothetical protein FA13DRAFT_1806695 [Coprinellus micaceus]